MAGWDRNANWDRDALERIVALLFALANLADRAAEAPFLRRRQVLEILWPAEAEARAFLIGISTGAPVPADAPESAGDAACLAASFRALALLLCALLVYAARFALAGATSSRAGRQTPAEPASCQAVPPLAPDTS